MDCKRCQELKDMLIKCASLDANIVVPERDYATMNPKEIYEAGLMDGGMGVRDAIRTMLWDERILGCDEAHIAVVDERPSQDPGNRQNRLQVG